MVFVLYVLNVSCHHYCSAVLQNFLHANCIASVGHNCKSTYVQGNIEKADSLSADQKERQV